MSLAESFLRSVGGLRLVQGGGSVWDFGNAGVSRPDLKRAWDPSKILTAKAPGLMADPFAAGDAPVFLWEAEQRVLGKLLPAWNQSSIGSCVSHGVGRAAQDLALWEIAAGEPEEWPADAKAQKDGGVCREAIYGGSRVEVGGGRLNGDGSIGAWAVEWLKKWGVLLYRKYGSVDLSDGYRVDRCRDWGNRGCPDSLEPEARLHPVKDAAHVINAGEAWAAIGAGKPVQICSDVGFDAPRDRDGFCPVRGSWAHCMCLRARFLHPTRGRSFVIQNSWGEYLTDGNRQFQYVDEAGTTKTGTLPNDGCFCVSEDAVGRIVGQDDSDALAGFAGWQVTRVDYTP